MAKVTASASINRPTRVKLRLAAGTGLAFIFLRYRHSALHLRVDRAVIGVGPGFDKCRGERRAGALQAGLEAAVIRADAVLVCLVLPGPRDRLAGLHRHRVGLVGSLLLCVGDDLHRARGGCGRGSFCTACRSKWGTARAERRRGGDEHDQPNQYSWDASRGESRWPLHAAMMEPVVRNCRQPGGAIWVCPDGGTTEMGLRQGL